ncbi:hypothetical protein CLAFUW4_01273 [Fulvia fulva]|uniref:Uncharacterized protein n=1 Tax=Passalora fulva TaxID=5499 RepID=A0A9Q8L620_PASFU|nr:uncharacterized protein CLAFUR5_01278 [Fulvia fulva]KAK4635596.1 hypothetical protein CLAFUR4_01274 [Fulvia fulva]KAK4637344.1 hypothetical protein CLAFUR0_01275 [Fulvia fulva]UJO11464.1 hypothetical protein CLAFUR5_01278 [Fulvia fulva]WPV08761.1 hypothetical protein CLAFUW4_01273 [Fulvia fulva]WPV24602.1 hypothetical protein CLAFUW7_01278 [Fulvia fulva]
MSASRVRVRDGLGVMGQRRREGTALAGAEVMRGPPPRASNRQTPLRLKHGPGPRSHLLEAKRHSARLEQLCNRKGTKNNHHQPPFTSDPV